MFKQKLFVFIFTLLAFKSYAQNKESLSDKIGAKTYEMVKNTYGIYKNDSLLNEVSSIGRALEKHLVLEKPLNYFLLDTPEPNAFATEGGYVYVTRGLLGLMNNKDELAGVMAHEISHVTERHNRKMLEARIAPLVLKIPGNLLGLLVGQGVGNLVNLPIDITSSIAISSFSRSQEKDADLVGVALATKAGFEPYGLVFALARLEDYIESFTHEPTKKSLLLDHPLTDERVKYLSNYLAKHHAVKTNENAGTSIAALNNLLYGSNPNYGMVENNTYLNTTYKFKTSIPNNWLHQTTINNLTAVSQDKKSALVISIDTTKNTLNDLVNKELKKINASDITSTDTTSVNGLKAYRISVQSATKKMNLEQVWIELPSQQHIKLSALYQNAAQRDSLLQGMYATQLLVDADYDSTYYTRITLKELKQNSTITEYIKKEESESNKEVLVILNNCKANNAIVSQEKYIKVFEYSPIKPFKK
jgi:predicted Zn-dependent protease